MLAMQCGLDCRRLFHAAGTWNGEPRKRHASSHLTVGIAVITRRMVVADPQLCRRESFEIAVRALPPANKIRTDHQPQDRRGPRPDHPSQLSSTAAMHTPRSSWVISGPSAQRPHVSFRRVRTWFRERRPSVEPYHFAWDAPLWAAAAPGQPAPVILRRSRSLREPRRTTAWACVRNAFCGRRHAE
jgi:hypothetical protein